MTTRAKDQNPSSGELSDAEKTRIRLEEQYRFEVKRQLAADSPKQNRLMSVLNQPFTLWLMSSVVIALISWGYTIWSAHDAERRSILERERHLAIEAEAKVQTVVYVLQSVDPAVRNDAHNMLSPTRQKDDQIVIFPELKGRSFESLMSEMAIYCASQPPSHDNLDGDYELILGPNTLTLQEVMNTTLALLGEVKKYYKECSATPVAQ